MKLDHPRVASGLELDSSTCRIRELLDEEILPRLERPARCLGPLEPRGITLSPADSTRFVLVWPSVLESHALPQALRPLWDALRERLGASPHFAAAPPSDLVEELSVWRLPVVSRPACRPLTSYRVWLVWLQWPHQIFGLLTLLRVCGLRARAADRDDAAPLVLVAGPGCKGTTAALRVFGDGVLTCAEPPPALDVLESILASPAPRESLSTNRGVQPSIGARGRAIDDERVAPEACEADAARLASSWVVQDHDLSAPLVSRATGALGTSVSHVRVWAASERLRSALGLAQGEAIVRSVADEFAVSSEVVLEVAVGLPGETPEDVAAILPLAQRLALEAPHGPKQLLVRVAPYLGPGSPPATVRSLRPRLARAAAALAGAKIRADVGEAACAWTGAMVSSVGTEHAGALERMQRNGVRVGESELACRTDLWHKALQAEGALGPKTPRLESAPSAMTADVCRLQALLAVEAEDSKQLVVAADTGLDGRRYRRELAGSPSRPQARPDGPKDRWTRWRDLAPRQFEYRIEFAKRGPMRFLGHRELWSLWVGAIAAAKLPLATSGLVQPRPKITFGPPLPLGVEGLREYVDVSLTQKTPDLESTLNDRLPEGLRIHKAAFIPAVAGRVSLGMVSRADYEATLAPRHVLSCELPTAAVLERADRLANGSAGVAAMIQREETTIDLSAQVVFLRVCEESKELLRVTFSLDLTPAGAKARPQDVLAYLLADEARDLRTIPMQRLCLLVPRDESSGRLLTPMDQVLLAHRTLRARTKMCA